MVASWIVAVLSAGASVLGQPSNGHDGVQLTYHAPLDDVDPAQDSRPWTTSTPLTLVAAAGERERAAFVVRSGRHAGRLDVQRPELASGQEILPATSTTIRRVRRVPVRTQFLGDRTEVVGRFAPVFTPHPMPSGGFEELWLEVEVPPGTPAGVYAGNLEVGVGAHRTVRSVRVRVRDMSLAGTGGKHLAMYYSVPRGRPDGEAQIRRDLADMRRHGVDTLVTDVRPHFGWGQGRRLLVDTQHMRAMLRLAHEAGFRGTVVVDAGLVPLARLLGHDDVAYAGQGGASLDGDAAFAAAAAATLQAVADVDDTFEDFDVVVMYLDEIFEQGRLPLFERLAPHVRRSGLESYVTLSTRDDETDALRHKLAPWLDVRCHHGFTFEWWMARGGTPEAFSREVERSGDAIWFYHNERGTYFTGRWARLVNGLYLWASPFSTHVTWTYRAFEEHPLDDGDGRIHDFGMSFPDPDNPVASTPTRLWTALSEGYDDLRYLAALERAIERWGGRAPQAATRARTYLQDLRADVMRLPETTNVARLPSTIGTPAEAPLLDSLARRYDDAALAFMRSRIEEHILALEVAGGRSG